MRSDSKSNYKKVGFEWIDSHGKRLAEHSKKIWAYAELALEEKKSAEAHIRFLEKEGFSVQRSVAGIPTAFLATWGKGKPVIGINCEYDALPGLSQEAAVAEHKPIVEGAPGHGCGHSLLGTGSVGAASALKHVMEKYALKGTVTVIGAPAEELCAGKAFMAREGVLAGFDAIIDWHPYVANSIIPTTCNAYFSMKYHFQGRTSHGNSPWEGRSALDGAVLAGHAIEMLREHIPPSGLFTANTINYTFSDAGPEYPNVVPDRSTVWCIGRLQTADLLRNILERVHRCFEGAAMATGCELTKEFITITHEMIPNAALAHVMYRNAVEIGPPVYTGEEQAFAREIQKNAHVPQTGMDVTIQPFIEGSFFVTDSSEYSWFAPTAIASLACAPPGVTWHNWQAASCANSNLGFKGMLYAAKVLTATVIDLLVDGKIIKDAGKELSLRLKGKKFGGLLPETAPVPLGINRKTMEKYGPLMEKAGRRR
jgi:aminobenzoyl-glutamate utilization protein B